MEEMKGGRTRKSASIQGSTLEIDLACHNKSKPSITRSILIPGRGHMFTN
jgi:hypothetical protein